MIFFSLFVSLPSIFFMATLGNNYAQYIHYVIFSYIASNLIKKGMGYEN